MIPEKHENDEMSSDASLANDFESSKLLTDIINQYSPTVQLLGCVYLDPRWANKINIRLYNTAQRILVLILRGKDIFSEPLGGDIVMASNVIELGSASFRHGVFNQAIMSIQASRNRKKLKFEVGGWPEVQKQAVRLLRDGKGPEAIRLLDRWRGAI